MLELLEDLREFVRAGIGGGSSNTIAEQREPAWHAAWAVLQAYFWPWAVRLDVDTGTPEPNTVAVFNTGTMEFPFDANVGDTGLKKAFESLSSEPSELVQGRGAAG